MSTLLRFALAGLVAGYAIAQENAQLPSCSTECITADYGGCEATDIECICTQSEWIANLACCISTACDTVDQEQTINFANAICGSAGAADQLPTTATCAAVSTLTSSVPPTTVLQTSFIIQTPTDLDSTLPPETTILVITQTPSGTASPNSTSNASTTIDVTSGTESSTTTSTPDPAPSPGTNTIAIGAGVGGGVGALLLGIGAFWFWRRRRAQKSVVSIGSSGNYWAQNQPEKMVDHNVRAVPVAANWNNDPQNLPIRQG